MSEALVREAVQRSVVRAGLDDEQQARLQPGKYLRSIHDDITVLVVELKPRQRTEPRVIWLFYRGQDVLQHVRNAYFLCVDKHAT